LLHITNGDCAVAVISKVVSGTILPWRDVLHEGPVRAGLSLEALSEERAAFIADAGWGSFDEVLSSFKARDAAFRRAGEHDEIVLWFEHDLYDQSALIRLLRALRDVRLLVLTPTPELSIERRNALLASLKEASEAAQMPVLVLVTPCEERLEEAAWGKLWDRVSWPCRTSDLAWHIEAALARYYSRPTGESVRNTANSL
jgi:hypothetical protein